MQLELSDLTDCLCDFTYDFYWQHMGKRLSPLSIIPRQVGSTYSYQDLVTALKKGENVNIKGIVGKRLGSSLGVDLKFFGGTGTPISVGSIIVDGDVDTRMGISMVSGIIYVKGNVKQPLGNVVEIKSDRSGYRKFKSITEILSKGSAEEILPPNVMEKGVLYLKDGIIRDTIAARLDIDRTVIVEDDAGMSTGILMKHGTINIEGDTRMNTAVLMRGGTIITGNTGEFAGAYMKGGALIIRGKARGYVGANMKGGVIFYKGDAMLSGSRPDEKDIRMLIKILGISQVEAMMFKRYG